MLSHLSRKFAPAWLRATTACVAVATCSVSCAPLTFSDDGAIDFQEYSSVRVELETREFDNKIVYESYLVGEMRRVSGFDTVTADPGRASDVVLSVVMTVTTERSTDDDGEPDYSYTAEAHFVSFSSEGEELDRDVVSDTSYSFNEAVEDALDEIATHFIRPYRI